MKNRRDFVKTLGMGGTLGLLPGWPERLGGADAGPRPPRIKVGQIGVGHAHASKLEVYRRSPDYEVVGIVEHDPRLRKEAQRQEVYRDLRWMTQEELLNVPGLEVVLVETRVRDLLETGHACVAANKHIHLDKPAGQSLDRFRALLNEAARRRRMVQMGYMYRYNPAILLLRDLLRRGWLGEPFELHAVMSKVVPPANRMELAEFEGGIMFELGCHLIDLVVGLLGRPDRITPYRRHVMDQTDALTDNMLAVFEYPKALATVKTTALEVEGFARRHLVVCGTEGTMHIQPLDNPSARLALAKPKGDYQSGYQEITFPKYSRYEDDAADMARVLRGEKENDYPYTHDMLVQTCVLQASGMSIG